MNSTPEASPIPLPVTTSSEKTSMTLTSNSIDSFYLFQIYINKIIFCIWLLLFNIVSKMLYDFIR